MLDIFKGNVYMQFAVHVIAHVTEILAQRNDSRFFFPTRATLLNSDTNIV